MIRLVLYFIAIAAAATGLSWLADRPGSMIVSWQGYELETSVFRAVVILALVLASAVFLWSLLRQLWNGPAVLGHYFSRRRQERGLDALSSGLIAIGAGDRTQALRHAMQARKALPNEPLTHLLRAQAAQLAGDRSTSRRIFEAMLAQPDTEQVGLRGLFLEAVRENEGEAARQFAERALRLNPRLGWPLEALFEMQCRDGDWEAARDTLATGRRHGHFEKAIADRRRAVLLTAEAQEIEEANGPRGLELAAEAHGLAPDLIPAAVIAGRQLASRGATPKAAKIVERTWKVAPHPDLALVYAFARPGDSPKDRFERVKRLSRLNVTSPEGPIALAAAAIEARDWDEARAALAPLTEGGLSQRICTLMARLEGEANQDAGRVREWLGRAAGAMRDPVWTADGVVSDRWAPVSPVTGALDAFQWRVPEQPAGESDAQKALKQIEELVLLGTSPAASSAAPGAAAGAGVARIDDRPRPRSPIAPAVAAREPVIGASVGSVGASVPTVGSAPRLEPAGSAPLRAREPLVDRPITIEVHPVKDSTAAEPESGKSAKG